MAKQQACWCAPHKDIPALGTSHSDSDWTKGFCSIYRTYLAPLLESFAAAVPVLIQKRVCWTAAEGRRC